MDAEEHLATVKAKELVDACKRVLDAGAEPDDFERAVRDLTHAFLDWHGDPRYRAEVAEHLVADSEGFVLFQSDKYPWCPAEFVPLKLTDPDARIVLRVYAWMHRSRDAAFSDHLLHALELERDHRRCEACSRPATHSDDEGTPLCGSCYAELLQEAGDGR